MALSHPGNVILRVDRKSAEGDALVRDQRKPPVAFAGIWRLWTGERKGETGEHQLFACLMTESNDVVVRPIHAKAMPVRLTNPDE